MSNQTPPKEGTGRVVGQTFRSRSSPTPYKVTAAMKYKDIGGRFETKGMRLTWIMPENGKTKKPLHLPSQSIEYFGANKIPKFALKNCLRLHLVYKYPSPLAVVRKLSPPMKYCY